MHMNYKVRGTCVGLHEQLRCHAYRQWFNIIAYLIFSNFSGEAKNWMTCTSLSLYQNFKITLSLILRRIMACIIQDIIRVTFCIWALYLWLRQKYDCRNRYRHTCRQWLIAAGMPNFRFDISNFACSLKKHAFLIGGCSNQK